MIHPRNVLVVLCLAILTGAVYAPSAQPSSPPTLSAAPSSPPTRAPKGTAVPTIASTTIAPEPEPTKSPVTAPTKSPIGDCDCCADADGNCDCETGPCVPPGEPCLGIVEDVNDNGDTVPQTGVCPEPPSAVPSGTPSASPSPSAIPSGTPSAAPSPPPSNSQCEVKVDLECTTADGVDCADIGPPLRDRRLQEELECIETLCYDITITNVGTDEMDITVLEFTFDGETEELVDQVRRNPLQPGESTSVELKIQVDICTGVEYDAKVSVEASPPNGPECDDVDKYNFKTPTQKPTTKPRQEPTKEPTKSDVPSGTPSASPTKTPTGSCCINGHCEDGLTEEECEMVHEAYNATGTYRGDGTTCPTRLTESCDLSSSDGPCPPGQGCVTDACGGPTCTLLCGDTDQPCCQELCSDECTCTCGPGLTYNIGSKSCEMCGEEDELCCSSECGDACNPGFTCLATGRCTACGDEGQPHCDFEDGKPCLAGIPAREDGTCDSLACFCPCYTAAEINSLFKPGERVKERCVSNEESLTFGVSSSVGAYEGLVSDGRCRFKARFLDSKIGRKKRVDEAEDACCRSIVEDVLECQKPR